jgi:hypothetical protein
MMDQAFTATLRSQLEKGLQQLGIRADHIWKQFPRGPADHTLSFQT